MTTTWDFGDGSQGTILRTCNGFEPAFRWNRNGQWEVEPGSAKPTLAEAIAAMDRDWNQSHQSEAAERLYQSGIAYACGYRD